MGLVAGSARRLTLSHALRYWRVKKSLVLPVAVSVAVAIAYVISTYAFASGLPNYVATHFDSTGRPNGGMTREGLIHFDLAMGLGCQVFVSLVCYVARYLPRKMLNVPHPDYWRAPENFPTACANVFRHSLWLGSVLALWMILINYEVAQANRALPPRLDTSAFLVAMVTFGVMLMVWVISMWRTFRVPDAATKKKARR